MKQLEKDINLIRDKYGCLKTPLALAIIRVCQFAEKKAEIKQWKKLHENCEVKR